MECHSPVKQKMWRNSFSTLRKINNHIHKTIDYKLFKQFINIMKSLFFNKKLSILYIE